MAKAIDVRHKLIAKAQILHKDWFGLLTVRPHLILRTASVTTEVGLKGSVLEPADIKLRIVIVVTNVFAGVRGVDERSVQRSVVRGKILPAANISAPVGRTRGDEVDAG